MDFYYIVIIFIVIPGVILLLNRRPSRLTQSEKEKVNLGVFRVAMDVAIPLISATLGMLTIAILTKGGGAGGLAIVAMYLLYMLFLLILSPFTINQYLAQSTNMVELRRRFWKMLGLFGGFSIILSLTVVKL